MNAAAPEHARFLTAGYRRTFVALFLVIAVLNFADRAIFSALAQTIKQDMALTDLQLGLLQGLAFALLYAAVGLPVGLLAERFARKRIIAAATVIWSAATIATGLAGSFVQLAAARLFVGMGEAGFTPPTSSLVADFNPPGRRASVIALIMLGSPIGAFVGATGAGLIAAEWGWRMAFVAFGVPGFIAAAALLLLVPEPPRGLVDPARATPAKAPPVREFLRAVAGNRTLQWVMAAGSIAGFGMTAISQFLAVFIARSHQLEVREAAALFGSVSGLGLAIGLLVGSFGTDWLSRRDPRWAAWGAALGLTLAAPVFWLGFAADGLWTSIALLVAALACMMAFYGPTAAMIANLLPPRMRASGSALYLLLYTLVGSGLGPVFVGFASDRFGAAAYGGGYTSNCPNGLPPVGAGEALASACRAASATGLEHALQAAVGAFFVAALCFLVAGRGLRKGLQAEA